MGETSTSAPVSAGTRASDWLWICAIWCAGGLFDASQTVLVMRDEGGHHPWLPLFATEFATWLPWVLATPLISGLARRFPVTHAAGIQSVAVHGASFTLISLI